MGWTTRTLIIAATAGSGVVAARALIKRRARHHPGPGDTTADRRWHTLTVNRDIEEVAPDGRLPHLLAELSDVEVQVRPAPAGRGTELAVRLLAGEPGTLTAAAARMTGNDPRHAVRKALRETRSLLEAGEILLPDAPSTTRRTLLNRPLAYATRHGREEGLL